MFAERDLDWLFALLRDAADKEILPRFRRLEPSAIRQKTSIVDLVTDADAEAERMITAALRARYPQALIVGEEACSDDPSLLDGLAEAELAFTLDPVDGTFNFASGVPLFGVMLGVVQRGETVAGLIYDPFARDCAIAVKGAGAWFLREDGHSSPAKVAAARPVAEMTGAVGWYYTEEPIRSLLAKNQAKMLAAVNYRAAAHEYRAMVGGHIHFVFYNKLMPWDHLPGSLIHAEAGGHGALLDGSAYGAGIVSGGLLLAPDRASWDELRRDLWAA